MATSASEASAQPLTLVMLVGELEKLRKDVTGALTASMNTALASIQASLQKITDTVATHTATITGMGNGSQRSFRWNHYSGARGGRIEIQVGDH
ncbi:hypothetical protein CgunFtcFv8_005686 [Champsocephalus gunnari]|nr:hypothetical protein CgunFtcFv8_005686 [Champsocephalus gunnari]